MNTDIRIAILTLSRGIIQSKADPLRREKLCPNLLSPKFADAQMSSNFLPKFFVLKYIEPKVLAHKFLNIKVWYVLLPNLLHKILNIRGIKRPPPSFSDMTAS